MCTFSWISNGDGYEIHFNRDEQKSRKKALLVSLQQSIGTNYLAPTDSEKGGTWIATNEHGLTLCLSNVYDESDPRPTNLESRGIIIPKLIHHRERSELVAQMGELSFEQFVPFKLFIFDGKRAPLYYLWKKGRLEIGRAGNPESSSSVNYDRAQENRNSRYQAIVGESPTSSKLEAFQKDHENGEDAVCAHRDKVETVSYNVVSVKKDEINFTYHEGSPCKDGEETVQLIKPKTALEFKDFLAAHTH